MKNIKNNPSNANKYNSIKMLLISIGLFCMPAYGVIAPWVKDREGYQQVVFPFIKEHPLVLTNLKKIKHISYQHYHLIYTYTTTNGDKKTCTAKFGPTVMFKKYIKFYGSNCPISKWQEEEDFFF